METLVLLSDHLKRQFPVDVDVLTRKQLEFVTSLAWDWVRRKHPHRTHHNACPLFWQRVREGGFRNAESFDRFNDSSGWFDVIGKSPKNKFGEFSKKANVARAYLLARQDVAEAIAEFLRNDAVRPKLLTDFRKKPKNKSPRAIVSKDANGCTRKSKGQLKSSIVPVDVVALIQACERFQRPDDRRKLYALEAIIHAANVQDFGPGHLVQQYRECPHGRLMGLADGIHLQTAPKDIRDLALTGQWDYDIQSCHLALMHEIARTQGTPLESIEYAITDKQKFRNELAERHGMAYVEVKKAIQALSYGAAPSTSPYCAFRAELFPHWSDEQVADVLPGFFADDEIQALVRDIKVAHHIIMTTRQVSRKRTRNVLGKFAYGKRQTLVSHILTGYEALALDIAIEHTDGHLSLLMHDGFVSPVRIDPTPIVQRFKQATGLRIKYEENQLSCAAT